MTLSAYGVKVTGCTVHVATEQVDHGPILAQEAVPVLPDDDEASLHERIKDVERRLYPLTLRGRPRLGVTARGRSARGQGAAMVAPAALLSVFDKAGIVELADGLQALGWRLISSGGTAKALAEAGLDVTDIAELTGVPAIFGHRVVTLHPKVHGGILADVDDPAHLADLEAYGIEPISLVVSNLYPFDQRPGIEMIDIGGPAMVRAAAKNHAHVGVVVDPADYATVLAELAAEGALTGPTRRRAGPQGLRPHGRLRRRHRHLARRDRSGRRRGAAGDAPPRPRAGPGAALRREPAPAGRPLPPGRRASRGGTAPCSTAARSSPT